MDKKSRSGIYAIVNIANGKRYIGSAVSFSQRWWLHRKNLRENTHHCAPLQNAWNKHGEEGFAFQILEFVDDRKVLLVKEQHYLDTLAPEYNVSRKAGSRSGLKNSVEHRAKISAALSAPEAKAVRSAIWKGRKQTPEHIAARIASQSGKRRKGHVVSPETKAKMRAAAIAREAKFKAAGGRPAPTPEALAKMSEAGKAGAAKRHAEMTPDQKAAWADKISATKLAKR